MFGQLDNGTLFMSQWSVSCSIRSNNEICLDFAQCLLLASVNMIDNETIVSEIDGNFAPFGEIEWKK